MSLACSSLGMGAAVVVRRFVCRGTLFDRSRTYSSQKYRSFQPVFTLFVPYQLKFISRSAVYLPVRIEVPSRRTQVHSQLNSSFTNDPITEGISSRREYYEFTRTHTWSFLFPRIYNPINARITDKVRVSWSEIRISRARCLRGHVKFRARFLGSLPPREAAAILCPNLARRGDRTPVEISPYKSNKSSACSSVHKLYSIIYHR